MKAPLVLLTATVLSASASAAPTNLLTNGSFESFSGGAMSNGTTFNTSANPLVITGWSTTMSANASNPGNGVSIQQTPGTTLYGGTTTADDAGSISPDAAGSHAAYFVDDTATETLSQTIALVGGTAYSVGFDYYQVQTGNPNPFSLSATLGNQSVTTVTSASATPGTWFNASQTFVAPTSGNYAFNFIYQSGAVPAADTLVDRVYVAAVPEPMSIALLISGLVVTAFLRRRNY